ncbi:deoxynucleoside triphosphate triphosphohydrolase SAMHD1-like [Trichomycterus rosablanca]|uniref:deoxynucleoside triphosphate triphosphohydrolase SAMHD1-like n=1 Tax=Trichomycterus rosablanca TaxID=2290929 RepID=UPI002F3568E2
MRTPPPGIRNELRWTAGHSGELKVLLDLTLFSSTSKNEDVNQKDLKPSRPGAISSQSQIFNDSVHGHIKMDSVLLEIIDTPEFQRLRNIKQLGGGYYVFQGASHNRFEHSIGVAHLAGQLVQSLMENQEDLGITYKDKLCIQIAALCHDLGHGPFSHLFEDFMKRTSKVVLLSNHEKQSIIMFDHLIAKKKEKLQEKMKSIGNGKEFTQEDFQFIKDLISGSKPNPWPYKERSEEKLFLFDILANKTTGIDVDKMDYFSRDCLHLGMKNNFSHERFVMFARVCKNEKGINQICMRDKEALNMYEIFHVRYLLYNNACHHRVTEAIQTMIVDALLAADNHFELEKSLKISEAVKDPEVYLRFTDNILQDIMRSSNPKLEPAKKIIERIETRDLYKFVGGDKFDPEIIESFNTDEEWKKIVKNWLQDLSWPEDLQKVDIKDIRVKRAKLNYGMDKDPIEKLLFYRKNNKDKAVKLEKKEISHLLPERFAEMKVMMFYTGPNQEILTTLKDNLDKFWMRVNLCRIGAARTLLHELRAEPGVAVTMRATVHAHRTCSRLPAIIGHASL